MGSLADKKCAQGQRVSGILVKKNFNYHILNPSDLSSEYLSHILHWYCTGSSVNACQSGLWESKPNCVVPVFFQFLKSATDLLQICCPTPGNFKATTVSVWICAQCWCVCFAAYTELSMSTVKQTQAIPFTGPYSLLVCHLRNLTGKTWNVEWPVILQFDKYYM